MSSDEGESRSDPVLVRRGLPEDFDLVPEQPIFTTAVLESGRNFSVVLRRTSPDLKPQGSNQYFQLHRHFGIKFLGAEYVRPPSISDDVHLNRPSRPDGRGFRLHYPVREHLDYCVYFLEGMDRTLGLELDHRRSPETADWCCTARVTYADHCPEARHYARHLEELREQERERRRQEDDQRAGAREGPLALLIAEFEHFPHYQEEAFLDDYARRNMTTLVDERSGILNRWRALHDDREYVAMLKERSPETYERAAWEVKALAIAERLAVQAPPRPPPEPERPRLNQEEVRNWLVERELRDLRDEKLLHEKLIAEGITDEDEILQRVAQFRRSQQERAEARGGSNGIQRLE